MLKLMDHQRRLVEIARGRPRYAWYWEPGAGKTIGVLAAIADAKARGFQGSTVVLAPKSVLTTTWAADGEHFPTLRVQVCWAESPAKRRRLIDTPADVYVTNYECFKKHAADFLAAGVTRLVIDESSKIKCPTTQISRACHTFADAMDSVFVLSGTPAPNNQTEYWSQMRCVDRGVFGPSFWRFAYEYFAPIKRTIDGRERIIGWKPLPPKREHFLERLRSASWSLRKSECLDLPPQTDVVREVTLSAAERAAYESMLAQLRVEFADGRRIDAAAQSRLMKLRQITGGLLYGPAGAVELGRSKIDELLEVLEEIGDRPAVVWCEFTAEIDRVIGELADRGRAVGRLDGRVGIDDRTRTIRNFQAGRLQNVVCHPAAAGHGVTLVAAPYAVYYSHSFSFEQYQQSRDRIHRVGQRENTTYYHLIARKTIDAAVWNALRGKRNAHEEVMDALGIGDRQAVAV